MSTAASPAAELQEPPEKVKEIHSAMPASETRDDHEDEKPAMTMSDYWGLVPKKQYKDGTPWRCK